VPEGERTVLRVLIVAAYASVRAGLHALLADTEDCEVIGEISGSAELERLLPVAAPDVVLFDANEGDAERVREVVAGSEAGLVVLSDSREGFGVLADAPLRGWGYLLKEAEGPEIAAAVRAAAAGLVALDRSLAPLLGGALGPSHQASDGLVSTSGSDTWPSTSRNGETLTTREREVLKLMAEGLPNKLIASRLSISHHTVKFHVASILAKLGAASRTEAVALGARLGYLVL
jgi:two-component system, NarL family, response regulator YdfI